MASDDVVWLLCNVRKDLELELSPYADWMPHVEERWLCFRRNLDKESSERKYNINRHKCTNQEFLSKRKLHELDDDVYDGMVMCHYCSNDYNEIHCIWISEVNNDNNTVDVSSCCLEYDDFLVPIQFTRPDSVSTSSIEQKE